MTTERDSLVTQLEPAPMRLRSDKTGYPKGWFCIAESDEVVPDRLTPAHWLGEQFVVFRSADGVARAADAYCPHLGAHLASHDGCVRDGAVVCPFHRWRYDAASGRCIDVPYGLRDTPPPVGLKMYPTREVDGMILIWRDNQGGEPDHEPYRCFEDGDNAAWLPIAVRTYDSTTPFPDVMENIIDTAHVSQLHGGSDALRLTAFDPAPYGATVTFEIAADEIGPETPIHRIDCHFTGLSLMTQTLTGPAFSIQVVYSFTPIDEERMVQRSRLFLRDLGSPELNRAVAEPFVEVYSAQVAQDYEILPYKKRLALPKLAAGDGPIMKYRQYADRYYA